MKPVSPGGGEKVAASNTKRTAAPAGTLAQIKVGDKISVTYYQSVAASMSKAGDPTKATSQTEAQTAKEGARPGASAHTTATLPVTIVSVDTQKNVVTFRGSDDLVRSTDVVSPEGKAFIKNLKAGDVIVIPAGTGHWYTRIDDHITYLMIRLDPDKIVPLKNEAASKAYLAR